MVGPIGPKPPPSFPQDNRVERLSKTFSTNIKSFSENIEELLGHASSADDADFLNRCAESIKMLQSTSLETKNL